MTHPEARPITAAIDRILASVIKMQSLLRLETRPTHNVPRSDHGDDS